MISAFLATKTAKVIVLLLIALFCVIMEQRLRIRRAEHREMWDTFNDTDRQLRNNRD